MARSFSSTDEHIEKKLEYVEKYYAGDDQFKYFTIINRSGDYTGNGLYPELVDDVCPLSGRKYKRGNPKSDDEPVKLRNDWMWNSANDNLPKDRMIRGLDIGCGRGSLTRFIASNLHKEGRLDKMYGVNIAADENKANVELAAKEGIPADKYEIIRTNFDDLSCLESNSFDLIVSNEAFYHHSDHKLLCKEIGRLLRKDGVIVFSDFITQPGVPPEAVPKFIARFSLETVANTELYDTGLTGAGLKKIYANGDKGFSILGHFGMQLYTATVYKKDELLGPNGVSKEYYDFRIQGINEWLDYIDNGLMENGWYIYKKQ